MSWCYARATDEYLLRLNNSSRTNIIEWWANVFRHLKRDGCYDFIRMTWESVYVILRHFFFTFIHLQHFVFMRFLSVRVFHFINIYSAPKFIFTSSYFVSTRYLETYHFIRLMYFKCGSLHKTMPQECNITLHIHRNVQWYRKTKKTYFMRIHFSSCSFRTKIKWNENCLTEFIFYLCVSFYSSARLRKMPGCGLTITWHF